MLLFLLFLLTSTSTSVVGDLQILSLTSARSCDNCKQWSLLLSELVSNTSIEVLNFSPETNVVDLQSYGIAIHDLPLPSTWAVLDGGPPHLFNYPRTRGFLERWLLDGMNDVWELVISLTNLKDVDQFESRYPVFVEIMAETYPTVTDASLLSQVGFAWFPQPPLDSNGTVLRRHGNVTIVQNAQGQVFHNVNKSVAATWRQLLPGIVHEDDFSLDFVQEIVSAYTTDEIHFEYNQTLPMVWLGQLERYPHTVFVQRPQLSTTPKTRVLRRDLEFVVDGVTDPDWLASVYAGTVQPVTRPSVLPQDRRTGVSELSADMLSAWVQKHPNSYLYFYNIDDQRCQNTFATSSEPIGRMLVPENDHEIFVERPTTGTAVQFVSGRPRATVLCVDVPKSKSEL